MADQKTNISSTLADKSWVQMKSVLNKEMPIKRDNRYLIILLLFFVSVMLGLFLYVKPGQPVPPITNENNYNLVHSDQATENLKNEKSIDDKIIETESRETKKLDANEISLAQAGLESKQRTKSNGEENLANNKPLDRSANEPTFNQIITTLQLSDEANQTIETGPSQQEISLNHQPKAGEMIARPIVSIQNLAMFEFNELRVPPRSFDLPNIPIIRPVKKQNTSSFDFGSFLAIESTKSSALSGFSLGLTGKYNINRKLNFTPYITYAWQKYNGTSRDASNFAADQVSGVSNEEPETNTELSQRQVSLLLESSKSIAVGINANYLIWNRLFGSVGGQYSYILNAKNNMPPFDLLSSFLPGDNYLFQNRFINRSQITFSGGLVWMLRKDFDVGLHYHLGASRIYSSSDVKAENAFNIENLNQKRSYFQLSVRAYLF